MDLLYNKDKLIKVCDHFSKANGVQLTIIDNCAGEDTIRLMPSCNYCHAIKKTSNDRGCNLSRLHDCYQAQRFGGRYIFSCYLGFTYFTTPIVFKGETYASVVGGPILMVEYDEFFMDEVTHKHGFSNDELNVFQEFLKDVPYVSPEKVYSLSELLFVCTQNVTGSAKDELESKQENQQLQGVISDYIMRIKGKSPSGVYPLSKEEDLMFAMSTGNVKAAKALLNEILGHIFFYTGFEIEVIRLRILELIVLLSRAAVKGGADAELIFGLNFQYIQEIDKFDNIEDMAYWISVIMNRFTDYVFNFVEVKHVDVIYNAMDHIKANYMKKITLAEVADHVYLSPTYFSKIFKQETGNSFNAYLNNIRIENSKKLLLNDHINLADISNLVGFEDQSYFSKVFKKVTGMTPLKYRQSRGK